MRIISKEPERFRVCEKCKTQIAYIVEDILHDLRYKEFLICPVCGNYIVITVALDYMDAYAQWAANGITHETERQLSNARDIFVKLLRSGTPLDSDVIYSMRAFIKYCEQRNNT